MTERQQFANQLDQIAELQSIFDASLGYSLKNKLLSYNPVIERWNFEQLQAGQETNFKIYEVKQVETALRERFQTAKSPINYLIDKENSLRNELLPKEPFTLVLERGIEYRKENGSQETEREESELLGFRKIQEHLLNPKTKQGSKMIVISGTGIIEETAYPHNFVDIYEKTKDESEQVVIKMTRMASGIDHSQYAEKALLFNPSYFDEFTGNIDAWFLANPIPVHPQAKLETPDDIFEQIFEKKKGTMREEEFEKLFEECLPIIFNYINILCGEEYRPREIAVAFNAILNKADSCRAGEKTYQVPIFNDVEQEAEWLGSQPVRQASAGCGISIGFLFANRFANSVAGFGIDDGKGPRQFPCPACGYENTRPLGGYVYKCQNGNCPDPDAVTCG